MSRILNAAQCRQLDSDMAELAAYRALGTVEQLQALLPEPSPLPLDLSMGVWVGEDPAMEAAGRSDTEQWHK